jgi:succinate dehydrogenase / fumarate reductase membrane anchor subunit
MRVWQIQRISAIALVVFLTIHMVFLHYVPGPGQFGMPFHVDFDAIIWRMGQPIWKIIDIGFLFFVLAHALAGTYAVLIDWQKIAAYKRALAVLAIVIGIGAFVYGTITVLSFNPAAIAAITAP